MILRLVLPLLFAALAKAEPVLEVHEIAPRSAEAELRLVLKVSNREDKDLFIFSEGLSDIPFFARFTQNGEHFDLPSHDCGTGSRSHRLRPKSYALIDVRVMQDILCSTPVGIRVRLFSDPQCQEAVWTNELKFKPDDFKTVSKPNQPAQHNARSRPSSGESPASETSSAPAPRG